MRKTKKFLILIILLFIISIAIDLPRIKLDLKPIGINFDNYINHIYINLNPIGINYTNSLNPSLGLDLKGGSELVLLADTSKIPVSQVSNALSAARNIINQRVNLYGVSNAQVYTGILDVSARRTNSDPPFRSNPNDGFKLLV